MDVVAQDQMAVSVLFDIDSLPVMSVKHNELSVTAGRFAREEGVTRKISSLIASQIWDVSAKSAMGN